MRGNAAGHDRKRSPARAARMHEGPHRFAGAAQAIRTKCAPVGGVRREQGGAAGVTGAALVDVALRDKRFPAKFPHARLATP